MSLSAGMTSDPTALWRAPKKARGRLSGTTTGGESRKGYKYAAQIALCLVSSSDPGAFSPLDREAERAELCQHFSARHDVGRAGLFHGNSANAALQTVAVNCKRFRQISRSKKIVGGLGSGGHNHSGRRTVEGAVKLSMAALGKAGGLRPGGYTTWHWSRGGERLASIGAYGGGDSVRLSYSVSEPSGPSRHIDERVAIEQRRCRFGGQRAFFCCPQCARAALNLHLCGGHFVCRACARLTYGSRRERARDRNFRAANKLRERLGGEAGALNEIADRPRGMWRRTYERIVAEIARREGHAHEELAGWIMKLGACRGGRTAEFWR